MDAQDGSLDGLTDLDAQDVADANRPYGEVTAEDLASDDLVADGADAEGLVTQDERLGVDAALHTDPPRTEETIDERLAQEVPDEGAEVAYGADASQTEGGVPGEDDATAEDA